MDCTRNISPWPTEQKPPPNISVKKQWGKENTGPTHLPSNKVITAPLDIATEQTTMEELQNAVRQLKQHKSGGPDKLTVELSKSMETTTLTPVLTLLQEWWRTEKIDHEALRSRVVHIYKKGDTSDLANYQPISLLNTIYKIYAVIVHRRIAGGIEPWLHSTQYGFRRQEAPSTQFTFSDAS